MTTILPVVDLARAHVAAAVREREGSREAASFNDSEGHVLCIHQNLP